MPRISSATIDEINARTDIVALIGEYVRLERKGGDYWGCCPFHNEKTPSFHVVPDRKMYHCFGCGAGGGIIAFLMEMEKMPFTEAAVALARKAGVEVIYEGGGSVRIQTDDTKDQLLDLYRRVAGTFRFLLLSTEAGAPVREYIQNRGISEETSERFMLGYAPPDRYWLKKFLREKNYHDSFLEKSGLFSKNYPDVSFFSDRLMFPICDRKGQPVAFGGRILKGDGPKYLNSGDMPQYKKGETLYAFHLAKNDIRIKKSVILCEGYMDVIAYHQAGICNAVAPLGTALTEDQVKALKSFAETVLLSFDSDQAGVKATERAILLCRAADLNVRIIQMSEKAKDPAEMVQLYGVDGLTRSVENAIMDSDYLLSVLKKTYPVHTPEGKSRASRDFFNYIEVLNSDIQKESSLEQLAQEFGLKREAVRADYNNRNSANKRTIPIQNAVQKPEVRKNIKRTAELRAVLAVMANMGFFPQMRSYLAPDDFEDPAARELFIVLEECYREETDSYDAVLSRCADEQLRALVTETITSGEFSSNSQQVIEQSIQTIRYNSLKRKKENLVNKLRGWKEETLDDRQQLNAIQAENMAIDAELRIIKEKMHDGSEP